MALLLTLDTSCVSAVANPKPTDDPVEVAALSGLIDMARANEVALQLTTAYDRDFDRWSDPNGVAARLASLRKPRRFRLAPGVFRLDVSRLGTDVLGGDEDVELDRRLRELLRARLATDDLPAYETDPDIPAKLFSDIDHLLAHRRSSANAFVTLDKGLLRKTNGLASLGIEVRRPTEIVARLRQGPAGTAEGTS